MRQKPTCQHIKKNGERCGNSPQSGSEYCYRHQPAEQEKPAAPQWLLDNITEASKNARGIYFLYVGFLVYCALTVISTTDRQLVLPQEKAKLPIINVEISVIIFFVVAPLVAIFIFWYFQLYLQKLKDLKDQLKSTYPNYNLSNLYPWMLNFVDEPRKDTIGTMRRIVVNVSLWWLLPGVLLLFPMWFIRKHDPVLSWVIGMLYPLIGTGLIIWFWCQHESLKITFSKAFWFRNYGKSILGGLMILFGLVLFPMGNYLAFSGIRLKISGTNIEPITQYLHIDLRYQKLIEEPRQDYETLYWLDLNGFHLEGANLTGAILKKADFRKANLTRSKMEDANIERANFQEAKLLGANFIRAQLSRANFLGTLLTDARFWYAQLDSTDFSYAQLESANFAGAQLKNVNFWYTQLDKAIFADTQLNYANFTGAKLSDVSFRYAQLDHANFRDAKLDRADFLDAQLPYANFVDARLNNANFWGAQLENANFQRAQLANTEFGIVLAIEGHGIGKGSIKVDDSRQAILGQIATVKTLAGAFLDSTLCADILEFCPYLLEIPKENE